jgi:uncharacterized membrane protein
MGKTRLEAFSDGVIAIIITIMVLELKVPHGDSLDQLSGLWPVFLSYILSFVTVGLYWNNHHHLLHTVQRVTGGIMWANMNLLFWLSLMPFTTGWMGENHFAAWPVAVYGLDLLMAAVAYFILVRVIIATHGKDSTLARATGSDWKGRVPLIAYTAAVFLAYVSPWISCAIYVGIAIMWLIPDRRIERVIEHR